MTVKILVGDCRERLKDLPDGSVHLVATSPPYWSLRDYGTEPLVWGGDAECEHEWGDELPTKTVQPRPDHSGNTILDTRGEQPSTRARGLEVRQGQFCQLCGCWRGSLGLEPTPDLYVQHIVEVMRGVKRVLRDDGTAWVNLGDSYASSAFSSRPGGKGDGITGDKAHLDIPRPPVSDGLKPKDLCGIPWRVAFALQKPDYECKGCGHTSHADMWGRWPNGRRICPDCLKSKGVKEHPGWYLRSAIIWAKGLSFAKKTVKCPHCKGKHEVEWAGSCMPESVRDRPTSSYEMVFLFSKKKRYYYDHIAVREGASASSLARIAQPTFDQQTGGEKDYGTTGVNPSRSMRKTLENFAKNPGRNLRNVWVINPKGFKEAHFATFPTALIRPMIMAGTSERGVCPDCGSQWARVVAHSKMVIARSDRRERMGKFGRTQPSGTMVSPARSTTIGWHPICSCYRTKDPRKRARQDALADYVKRTSRLRDGKVKAIKPNEAGRELLQREIDTFSPYLWSSRVLTSTAPTIPATCLDPFGGAGTVGVVATELGRDAVICELNQEYCEMSRRRIEQTEVVEIMNEVMDGLTDDERVTILEQISMFPVEIS